MIEVKTQTRIHGSIHIWVTNHLGEISRHLIWHLPQVFAYYPPLTSIPYVFTEII